MPMPRLLKRLSRKSLRKRAQSTASAPEVPLPVPKSAASEVSFGYVLPPTSTMPRNGSSPYLPPTDPYDKPTPPTPNGDNSQLAPNGTPYPPPPPPPPPVAGNGHNVPEDEFSKNLRGAWASATTDPKASKTDKVLLNLENGVAGAMEKQAKGVVIMTAVKTGLDAVGGLEAIEQGLNSFMEGMPVLMNALDEVAKLHPFIGVAVMAFKAVWALEQKRRDNDRKILALHMEMKEMMGVLTQLKNVKDADDVAPDGSTIKGRMQVIVNATAEDIKACANACDTYTKKKLVVKILKGPVWEGKLVKFAGTFTKRRSEFEFALSIHTALGVDAANQTLGSVDKTTQEMNMKMDMMMKMFQQFVAPEQKEMMRLVEQKGGLQACQENDKILQELSDFEAKSAASTGGAPPSAKSGAKTYALEDLKDDLVTDVDAAMEKNMSVFTRKFEIQQRQIIDELSRVVAREGDRVISAVTAGPHDKIIDPNVHMIWKEMGWRGSVKTRHFVMALRDHFQEGHKGADGQPHDHPEIVVAQADEWALEYINVVRLQAISEAFDDDASGFITVAEVNTFTTMRPLGWSLPHWLAYAAVGHHQAMQAYANKINEMLAKMFAILPRISPVNKSSVNTYLETVYQQVYTLAASINACYVNEALQERFATYVEAEEARLRANLEAVQYDIDALDTLALVTGEGRIDRFVLPLVYLLLQRHFEIIRVSQTRVVHPDELWDAADTVDWVFTSVGMRLELLRSIFTQQKLDLKQQFKSFSHGLYEYLNDPNLLWDTKLVQEAEFAEYTYDDSVEAQDVNIAKILNYPVDQEPLDFEAYTPPKAESRSSDGPKPLLFAEDLLGVQWHGLMYWPKTALWPSAGMFTMTLKPSSVQDDVQYFTAAERANRSDFNVAGECRAGDEPGIVELSFKRSFPTRYPTQYFTGTWNAATETLIGTVGMDEDPAKHNSAFVFKRIMPEYMCFWPAPVELETNKARALWGFAIAAVRYGVRRDRWSWSFFKERRDNRRRFIELYIRSSGSTQFGAPLTGPEWQELGLIKKTFSTADARFYHSLGEKMIRATVEHNASCDVCDSNIGGARITCLICQMKDTFNTIDLCSTPDCLTQRVMRDDMQRAHLPHHDLMKVRRVVHMRQFGKIYRDAKEALKHARTFFKSPTAEAENDSESEADTEDEEGHPPLSAKRLSRVPALALSIPQATLGSEYPMSAVSAALSHSSQVPDPVASGPSCCACKKPVSQPCWYCVACGEASFICWECDAKGEVSFGEHDFHSHDLVRVTELIEERDLTMEERLVEMEERFSKHEKTIDERLGRLEAAVDGRIARVEGLLEQLLTRVGHHETN
ncbi:hypothetical protein FB451DRAFT_1236685 [Mycena latifolia]|nr:hypothetical protein FB451DRAFT_1236685 [Mycena latifolia]